MKLVSNKRARLVTFEKRKKGLKKAAYELSTLCGVDIGVIICNGEINESEVWPPSPGTVARMIELCESSSDQDRRCRACGVADYIEEEREKEKKRREKARKADACASLSRDQLWELGDLLNAKIGAVREKISLMKAELPDDLMDTLLQECERNAWQQQATQHWACLDQGRVFMYDPSLRESEVLATNSGQQWTNFDSQESGVLETNAGQQYLDQERVFMYPSFQESEIFAGQQQKQLWTNFDPQESGALETNAGQQQQQQNWTYLDEECVLMYPSLQESEIFATNSGQQQQQLWANFGGFGNESAAELGIF